MIPFDLNWIRGQFPALTQEINGQPTIFFDGPGGTQVPGAVIDAIANYLVRSNANAHGAFTTSVRTDALVASARIAIADLLGCDGQEIIFGANMTSLAFAFSRAIAREIQPGDEIIVTKLDHAGNVAPWYALEEQGAIIHEVDINTADCTLDMNSLQQQLNRRTKLVAVGYAANATGTINDVAEVVKLAHAVGALVFVDAVHYAPHGPIDVKTLDCDFLACSGYKFFGPHLGILYGKQEHLARLKPYKVKPASDEVPSRWETGTPNFEGIAGMVAAINYLAKVGCHVSPSDHGDLLAALLETTADTDTDAETDKTQAFRCPPTHTITTAYPSRRAALVTAMSAIQEYEKELSQQLIPQLLAIPGLTFYGITDPANFSHRTPTVSIRIEGIPPVTLANKLSDRGIFTWHGNFYALGLTTKLGVERSGGLLRIGLVHYNTDREIEYLIQCLKEITELAKV